MCYFDQSIFTWYWKDNGRCFFRRNNDNMWEDHLASFRGWEVAKAWIPVPITFFFSFLFFCFFIYFLSFLNLFFKISLYCIRRHDDSLEICLKIYLPHCISDDFLFKWLAHIIWQKHVTYKLVVAWIRIFTNFICKLSGLLTLVTLSTTHLCPLNLLIFVDVLGEQCFTKNLGLSFTLLVLSVP